MRNPGERPIWLLRGLLLATWLLGAVAQAQAPVIFNYCRIGLGPPEETCETAPVDEFWLEPMPPRCETLRPAFGDVIGVELRIETEEPAVAQTPEAPPAGFERVPTIEPVVDPSANVRLVTFHVPGDAAAPVSAGARQQPPSDLKPFLPTESAESKARRELQRRQQVAQWSAPLLTKSPARPTPQAAPRTTVYDVLMWPSRRVSDWLEGPEESTHIYPTSKRR